MIFNDVSQYRVITDPARHVRERPMVEFRVASANTKNPRRRLEMYVDTAFAHHRETLASMPGRLIYQYPYQDFSPEVQAEFFCDAIGELRTGEMVMLDTECESRLRDPADFLQRWCAVVEPRLRTLAWVYVPAGPCSLYKRLTREVTGKRIVKAPRYSGHAGQGEPPWWAYDVWQYTDCGPIPGCPQGGDCNVTDWSVAQLVAHCSGGAAVSTARPTLRRGDRGPAVRELQTLLDAKGA